MNGGLGQGIMQVGHAPSFHQQHHLSPSDQFEQYEAAAMSIYAHQNGFNDYSAQTH